MRWLYLRVESYIWNVLKSGAKTDNPTLVSKEVDWQHLLLPIHSQNFTPSFNTIYLTL